MNAFLCQSFWVKTSRASSRLDNPQFYSSIVYKLDQWSLHSICGNRSARQTAAERRRPAGAHLSPRKRKPQPAWGGDGQKKNLLYSAGLQYGWKTGRKKKISPLFPLNIFESFEMKAANQAEEWSRHQRRHLRKAARPRVTSFPGVSNELLHNIAEA